MREVKPQTETKATNFFGNLLGVAKRGWKRAFVKNLFIVNC
jgi:hypothetical protein